jgi:hypothetical protein
MISKSPGSTTRERPCSLFVRTTWAAAAYGAIVLWTLWSVLALSFDFAFPRLRIAAAGSYLIATAVIFYLTKRRACRLFGCLFCWVLVLVQCGAMAG